MPIVETTLSPSPPAEPPSSSRKGPKVPSNVSTAVKGMYGVLLAGLLVVLLYPLFRLLDVSLSNGEGGLTLDNFSALRDSTLLVAARNSLWVAVGTTAASVLVALPLAWLAARSDLPGRRLLRNIVVLTFATPSFIAALGWVLLLGPRNGTINRFFMDTFGLAEGPLNIFTPWGIIFVLTTFLYPLVFLPAQAALENMDPQLEQAASGQGANTWRVFRTITLPLLSPAIAGGSMLVFVIALVTFGPVAILGTPVGFDTIPTALFRLLSFPPQIETAAVALVPVLACIAALLYLQAKVVGGKSFTTVGGKHGPRSSVALGSWRFVAIVFVGMVLTVSLVLPFGMLVVISFKRAVGLPLSSANFVGLENYTRIFQDAEFVGALLNSTVLAGVAVLVAAILAFLAAWLVTRHPTRANGLVSLLMNAPLAIPGAALGIALIVAYSGAPFRLGGHMLLLIAYICSAIPLLFTYTHAAIAQIGVQSEEASRSLGAGWFLTWRKVTLPMLKPAILGGALLNFVLLFRELETSIFLFNGSNPTLATLLYSMASDSLYQRMGALAVVILAINTVVVLFAVRWQNKR